MSLLQSTESLLEHSLANGYSLRQIAQESAGAIEYEWLKKFSANKIDDPSVNRIQALHDVLKRLAEHRPAA